MSIPPPLASEDPSEFEGMIAGKPYSYRDAYITRVAGLRRAKCDAINAETDPERRDALVRDFFRLTAPDNEIGFLPPLFCEYGFNVTLGNDVVIGHGCKFLDVAPIYIGDRTMLGPSVQIFTPVHPLLPEARNGTKGKEAAKAIRIEADCWLGGGCIVLPGVTVGAGSTVGAGAVVTKDVPPRSVVVGNPARVVKTLGEPTEDDIAQWR